MNLDDKRFTNPEDFPNPCNSNSPVLDLPHYA